MFGELVAISAIVLTGLGRSPGGIDRWNTPLASIANTFLRVPLIFSTTLVAGRMPPVAVPSMATFSVEPAGTCTEPSGSGTGAVIAICTNFESWKPDSPPS